MQPVSLNPSSSPSTTLFPTLSIHPSVTPSTSTVPLFEPSWSPTISSNPTASPYEELNFIEINQYARRYFPNMIDGISYYSYQQVPNCTAATVTASTTN